MRQGVWGRKIEGGDSGIDPSSRSPPPLPPPPIYNCIDGSLGGGGFCLCLKLPFPSRPCYYFCLPVTRWEVECGGGGTSKRASMYTSKKKINK